MLFFTLPRDVHYDHWTFYNTDHKVKEIWEMIVVLKPMYKFPSMADYYIAKTVTGKDGIIYSAINSCFVKICSLHGTSITTVEGLAPKDGQMHPIQVDWRKLWFFAVEDLPGCKGGQWCLKRVIGSASFSTHLTSITQLNDVNLYAKN